MTPGELRSLRRSLGWTVDQAAQRLGVTRRTYIYYEKGKTSRGTTVEHLPRPIAIAALAQRFMVELLGEQGIKAAIEDEQPA